MARIKSFNIHNHYLVTYRIKRVPTRPEYHDTVEYVEEYATGDIYQALLLHLKRHLTDNKWKSDDILIFNVNGTKIQVNFEVYHDQYDQIIRHYPIFTPLP